MVIDSYLIQKIRRGSVVHGLPCRNNGAADFFQVERIQQLIISPLTRKDRNFHLHLRSISTNIFFKSNKYLYKSLINPIKRDV